MKSKQSYLQCSVCGKQSGHRSSLFKHIKNSHPDNITGRGHILCKEKNCNFKSSYINVLRDHLTTKHSLYIESEELSFQSEEGTCIHTCIHVHTHIYTSFVFQTSRLGRKLSHGIFKVVVQNKVLKENSVVSDITTVTGQENL